MAARYACPRSFIAAQKGLTIMNNTEFWIYLLLMAGSTYLVRVIPFVLVKKKIENRFIKSFLTYIPYAVLTAMTIPGAVFATTYVWSAAIGLLVALILGLRGKSLTIVAVAACSAVFLAELIPLAFS